jgi:hypothetical protein
MQPVKNRAFGILVYFEDLYYTTPLSAFQVISQEYSSIIPELVLFNRASRSSKPSVIGSCKGNSVISTAKTEACGVWVISVA